jgi:hypothetical protein
MNGLERLDKLIQGQLDNALIKVVEYLKGLNNIDTSIFLNEEKTLKEMCSYVKDKAKEFAVNNVAIIEDNIVYNWSLMYWQKSNEELGIKKEEIKTIQKTNNVVTQEQIRVKEQEQLTLF